MPVDRYMNKTRNVAILLVSAAVLVAGAARADVRTWTDSSGTYTVEAEFVEESGGSVHLRKSDGRVISLPLERLSTVDQAYVQEQRDGAEALVEPIDPLAPSATSVTIELLSGAKVTGRISAKDDQSVTLEATVGSRTYTRKYPLDRIRAAVVGEHRTELNESSGELSPRALASSGNSATANSTPTKRAPNSGGSARSRTEIESLIENMGRTPPDWWGATPLDYPDTLDLNWPEKPEGQWNSQKNVGQYLWEVIQPNANKWHQGIRFVHFLLERHQGDREKSERAMFTLGRLYYMLLQDYARAAFWWRKAGVERGPNRPESVYLADCYWRLGSKPMALLTFAL